MEEVVEALKPFEAVVITLSSRDADLSVDERVGEFVLKTLEAEH